MAKRKIYRPAELEEPGELMTRTVELLKEYNQNYHKIYKATEIPPSWLAIFEEGKTKKPSARRVEKLYRFLAGKTAEEKILI